MIFGVTFRQLGSANNMQSKSMEKLSSGLRINRAGDDAAGLAISEKMRGQIRGLDMAQKNSQDAISMIQTAEGALNETHSILQRMRELAVQSSNDTNTTDDRKEIQKEFNELTSEINRIGNTTEFNTKKLLNGDLDVETIAGATSTTTQLKSETITVASAPGVDYSGVTTGEKPTFVNGTTENQIGFADHDGFEWSTLVATNANTLTLTKTAAGELTVDIDAKDGNASVISVADAQVEQDADGNYTYNAHGVNFTISKEDFDAMGASDSVVIDLNKEATTGSVDLTSGLGTANDWTTNTTSGSVTSDAAFTGGITIDGAALPEGAASFTVDFDGTDYTVEILAADGTTALSSDVVTLSDPTAGFTYNNHGISFTLDQSDASSLEFAHTFATEDVTTTAPNTVKDDSLTFQIGANQNQSMSLAISDMRASALGITGTGTGFSSDANVTDGTDNSMVEKALDVTSAEGAANAISVLDDAIASVSAERSKLGASQNRLEHTINNLGTSAENLTAAESRIRDVDMAKEMMQQTKASILAQASQAMLAQANQAPQGVLQLLR